jgi:hypothetical protein
VAAQTFEAQAASFLMRACSSGDMLRSVSRWSTAAAALAHRRMRPGLRYTLVVITAVVFTATLLVIFDLNRPFAGIATIKPTVMRDVEEHLGASPLGANPPCDALGAPVPL